MNEPLKVHYYGEGTSAAGWYFWNVNAVKRIGPYESESDAIYGYESYAAWLETQYDD